MAINTWPMSLFAMACATVIAAIRRQRKCADTVKKEEKLRLLLLTVKGLCKATYLIVSDAGGERFSHRALATVARKRGLKAEGTTRVLAEALVNDLEHSKRGGAAAYAPTGRKLRHALVRTGIDGTLLWAKFPAMRDAYVQQPLNYGRHSRYGDKWRISCYLVVLENAKPKTLPHQPMVECMGEIMTACVRLFEQWYCYHFSCCAEALVVNCFVTRYRPKHDENQLKRHIDGANVDGSVILALPTDDPFQGGQLRVWDGANQQQFDYPDLRPGDAILLAGRIWHQAFPITCGTRYALVLFLQLRKQPRSTNSLNSCTP